ncbi:MAG: hypothetical protein H7A46_03650 [Verrucomicrobiales bacterium]|nr:hypothetical protein [Verrucomicrobiales bacterium]
MRSSTLHFEPAPRGTAGLLLTSVVIALLACAGYTRWWNPEVRLYVHAVEVKEAWAEHLAQTFTNRTLVFGGSSTSFSIDPARMLDRDGLPVANYGLHAGMMTRFLTGFAAGSARPGDLLLMAMEPELLVVPSNGSDLAAQMGFALDQPEWIHASNVTGEPVHWVENLISLRPGAYHCFTLLGKILLGKPLYRYSPTDFSESGWQRTRERREIASADHWSAHLTPDSRALLTALRQWGAARDVRVAYLLPWQYVPEAKAAGFQADNLRFLVEISDYLPVLADPRLGAYSVREQFADTPLHLTPEGAAIRSDELAALLKAGHFWTHDDLVRMQESFPSVPAE